MIWNIQMDKFIDELKKDRIKFKEIQGRIVINHETIRTPSILYKPLEITIDGSIYKCQFYKMFHNTDKTEKITKEFIYLVPLVRYIKKYLNGML